MKYKTKTLLGNPDNYTVYLEETQVAHALGHAPVQTLKINLVPEDNGDWDISTLGSSPEGNGQYGLREAYLRPDILSIVEKMISSNYLQVIGRNQFGERVIRLTETGKAECGS
jgi:hypothetical protein